MKQTTAARSGRRLRALNSSMRSLARRTAVGRFLTASSIELSLENIGRAGVTGTPVANALTCSFLGATFVGTRTTATASTGGLAGAGQRTGFFLAMNFGFQAGGGTGSYTFFGSAAPSANGQTIAQIGYTFGVLASTSGAVSLNGPIADPFGPGVAQQNGGNLTWSDSPGLANPGRNGSVIVFGAVVWRFTLQISVTSGDQTVECPTVQWGAFEVWQNGQPVSWAAYTLP
jgi:hypothetical protein